MTTPLDIFRPGRHTASSGTTLDFSEAQLAASAQAYDPALHEAPLVIGHPKDTAPAYGWVKSLFYKDGHLQADPHQVDEGFAELVKKGAFKKMSASFYLPDAAANPKPGVYYLRHIGFLGAQPPAIKGLRDASFADGEDGTVCFGDWDDQINAGLWRRLRDWIIGKFGLEEADKVLSSWDLDQLKTLADQPDEPDSPVNNAAYAEEERMTTELERREAALNVREEGLKQQEASFTEAKKVLDQKAQEARKAEHLAFCEGLVKDGKLAPTHKEALVAFMASIPAADTLSFGEGATAKTEPSLAWLKTFLQTQPKHLAFGEAAGDASDASTADFAAAPGYEARPEDLEVLARAQAYQKANPGIDLATAAIAVQKGR